MSSENPTIYLFGDDHTDPREKVKDRLHSVIPATADVVVIEHAEKGDNQPKPSQWTAFKNPALLIAQLVFSPFRRRKRRAADRVTGPGQTTVVEDVADDFGLPTEYTDISSLRRVHAQPWYLTLVSWGVTLVFMWAIFLLLSAPLLISPSLATMVVLLFLVGGLFVCTAAVALASNKIHNRMREAKMAQDLRNLAADYSEIVFFTGDSHFDPIRERLNEEFEVIEAPDARP